MLYPVVDGVNVAGWSWPVGIGGVEPWGGTKVEEVGIGIGFGVAGASVAAGKAAALGPGELLCALD